MKTVFHQFSKELEDSLFAIIGEYCGNNSFNRLVFRTTKRRHFGRILIEDLDGKRKAYRTRWLSKHLWFPIFNQSYEYPILSLENLIENLEMDYHVSSDKLRETLADMKTKRIKNYYIISNK